MDRGIPRETVGGRRIAVIAIALSAITLLAFVWVLAAPFVGA